MTAPVAPRVRQEVVRAQPGPQRRFLASSATFTLYGGAAYGGKSYGLLLDPLRDVHWPGFRGVLFRETTPAITAPGGLWDVSHQLYPRHGARSRGIPHLDWRFPSGAQLWLTHLQFDDDVGTHQGSQYTWIGWDELTHHSARRFWYLFGRLRIAHAVGEIPVFPRVRATCNPDPDSWVAEFFAWWIDQDTGLPIPERAGVVRWFCRHDEKVYWGATVAEVRAQCPEAFVDDDGNPVPWREVCHTATFIPATHKDNAIGLARSPTYMANLRAGSRVDRARLLGGNWLVRETAGEVFREEWFPVVDETPDGVVARIRYWDLAGSKRRRSDFTAGVLFAMHADGTYTVEDARNEKLRPKGTEDLIAACAREDGHAVDVHIEQETGAAGELLIDQYQRHALRGFTVQGHRVRGEGTKIVRAKPASSAAEKGHIRVRRGAWNKEFFTQLEAFPDGAHDDMVDALSGAFAAVQQGELSFATARTGGR